MAVAVHIVQDTDEHEDFLRDGWKESPADFLDPDKDPRIPVGRELRRAAMQNKLSKEDEIRHLQLRLAELQGRQAPVEAAATERPKRTYTKRKRRITRRRPSQVAAARAAVEGDPPTQS